MLHIGFDAYVNEGKIVSFAKPYPKNGRASSAPLKRLVDGAVDKGVLLDFTFGHKTKTIIVFNSGHVVLSALNPETINSRINGLNK